MLTNGLCQNEIIIVPTLTVEYFIINKELYQEFLPSLESLYYVSYYNKYISFVTNYQIANSEMNSII